MGNLESALSTSEGGGRFKRAKHLLSILGLGCGTALAETDVLDRLNDIRKGSTPTSVTSSNNGHDFLGPIVNNPIFHKISHALVQAGISGGPNNTLGVLVAVSALAIGGVAARSYVHTDGSDKGIADYKLPLASVAALASGLYLGSQ